jgi:OOP family OmpA-OmpF porin
MKLKLITALLLLISYSATVAQKNSGNKKGQLFGLHYNMADFNSPAGIKDASTGKGYSSIRNMNKGFSLSYWKGLTTKIDLSVKANAIFRDFSAIYQGVTGKNEVGIELEPAVNIRPFDESAKLAPFLTTGVGVGLYNDKFGGYIPAGGGIQLNFDNLTYLFVQAQYKFTLTKKVLGDNLFYSIGFAQKF